MKGKIERSQGDEIYDVMSSGNAHQLQIIQYSCLCMCTGKNKRTPIDDLHAMARVPKLDVRHKIHTWNFAQKGV